MSTLLLRAKTAGQNITKKIMDPHGHNIVDKDLFEIDDEVEVQDDTDNENEFCDYESDVSDVSDLSFQELPGTPKNNLLRRTLAPVNKKEVSNVLTIEPFDNNFIFYKYINKND